MFYMLYLMLVCNSIPSLHIHITRITLYLPSSLIIASAIGLVR